MRVGVLARKIIPYGLHFDLEEGGVKDRPLQVRLGYPYREGMSMGDLIRFLFYQMLDRAFRS